MIYKPLSLRLPSLWGFVSASAELQGSMSYRLGAGCDLGRVSTLDPNMFPAK